MAIQIDLQASDRLVIAATGYGNKLNLTIPDFFRFSNLESTSKIVISDPSKLKTLAGLPPDFETFDSVLEYLEGFVAKLNPREIIITGTSGGGHTALLLGHILRADKVVAFSPYPYLTRDEILKNNDPSLYSMSRLIDQFELLPENVRRYMNLRDVLKSWNGKTEYYVHVSRYNEWDYRRALYLNGLPSLRIVSHPYTEHAVASLLHKDRCLANCFLFPYNRKITVSYIFRYLLVYFEEARTSRYKKIHRK